MSTTPPDYEYGSLKLKYIPPPPELEDGQIYLRKREFVEKTSGMYSAYFKENPFVPLGIFSTVGFLVVGFTFSMQKKHHLATRMMFGTVASQAITMLALHHGSNKAQKRKESLMAAENTAELVQDLSSK